MWNRVREYVVQLQDRQRQRDIWRSARRLSPRALQREDAARDLSMDDLLGASRTTPRFLGYYTRRGLETALDTYGITAALRQRGFDDLRISLDAQDRFTSTLRCYGLCGGAEHLLSETRCRLQPLHRPAWVDDEAAHLCYTGAERAVRVEWMLLQNPCQPFDARRPQLPGQEHPGLGLGREVMEVLRVLGWRLRVAAFDVNPFYVHNAVLYSRQFSFVEPEDQAFFLAVKRQAAGRSLQDLGLAVHNGFLRERETDREIEWPARTQISPLSRRLARLYHSPRYSEAVSRALREVDVRIDWAGFDATRDELVAALADPSE